MTAMPAASPVPHQLSAARLLQRYRRQLWLMAAPMFVLLAALALWQAWQARATVLATLERSAAQQQAAVSTLTRNTALHVADLRRVAELAQASASDGRQRPPDVAIRQALVAQPAGHQTTGWTLDPLPSLLQGGAAQLLLLDPTPAQADTALALMQALAATAEINHSRSAALAESLYLAAAPAQLMVYPWLPSSTLLAAQGQQQLAGALQRWLAHAVFGAGQPQHNPARRPYWTGITPDASGQQPVVLMAAPLYAGDDFTGVVASGLRLSALQDAVANVPAQAGRWWLLNERGQVLALGAAGIGGLGQNTRTGIHTDLHTDTHPSPPGLDSAALDQVRQAAGQWTMLHGRRWLAQDIADAPWTLLLTLDDSALAGLVLPGLLPFELIALALLLLIVLAQTMLRRRVINPALGVMGYLQRKSQDETSAAPQLGPRWQPWVDVVTRTFDARRAAHDAQRRSEAFKSAIVDHALAALVATDAQGLVVEFNPAAEAMFGMLRAQALGQSVATLIIPPRLRAAHTAGMQRMASGGPARMLGKRLEMQALRADGSEFPVEMVLWRTEVDGVAHYTASLADLSERHAAALQIERQRDALRQSEKLTAMGSLLAGVAHELNNPLAIVLGRAGLLEEKCADQPALAGDAQRIREAAERCGRIVRTFLNMARSRPSQRSAVDLNGLASAAADMLGYAYRSHGITLQLELAPGLPSVTADSDQIGQLLLNLLVNAQQALAGSSGPRQVLLRSGLETARPGREARVWLRVADSGPGIQPALAERIFEPFFTTKPEGSGTGLGLAVSRGLAREHGGSLVLEPPAAATGALGGTAGALGGACFRLSLPLNGAASPGSALLPLPDDTAPPASTYRLLVVDDEPELAELMRDMLESAGHEVAVAESGTVALALLDEARFDAIVSDLRMPDIDGASLWRQVQQRQPALAKRMLFVTGDTLSAGARAFLDETGCPGLDKPFSRDDLQAAVAALLLA